MSETKDNMDNMIECEECNGTGMGEEQNDGEMSSCSGCNGDGEVYDFESCDACVLRDLADENEMLKKKLRDFMRDWGDLGKEGRKESRKEIKELKEEIIKLKKVKYWKPNGHNED